MSRLLLTVCDVTFIHSIISQETFTKPPTHLKVKNENRNAAAMPWELNVL